MTYKKFTARLPAKERTRKTAYLFYLIHKYIIANGQTHLYDEHLFKYLLAKGKIDILKSSLRNHLRYMVNIGLLISHRIISRYTDMGKIMLTIRSPLLDNGFPPGLFKMYTLPGMLPSLKSNHP